MIVPEAVIRSLPLFASLRDQEVDRVVQASRRAVYLRRNVVFHEGEPGHCLFIVLSGSVKLVLCGGDGRQIMLRTLGPGDCFGVSELLEGVPRTVTAMTLERTALLQVTREVFSAVLARNAEFARTILVHAALRTRNMNQLIRELGFYGVPDRILAALLKMAENDQAGRLVVHCPPSRQELADRVSSRRETVSRAIKVLKDNGYLVTTPKTWILNRSAARPLIRSA